jgi:adenosylcobinamide-GDP ribazoletransferase
MHLLKRELDIFFAALTFLTRIPAPRWVKFQPQYLNAAARYFPLVGSVIALVSLGVFLIAEPFYGSLMAIILSVAASIFLTGAFHEDGFADFCDGFGGGWEKTQIITIMKDSRLGTYAALGIGLMLAGKIQLLNLTELSQIPLLMIIGHTCSRALAASYLYNYQYVQDAESSKVKPLATAMGPRSLALVLATGLLPLCWLPLQSALALITLLLLFRYAFGRYLNKKLGGYTGDCLGAAQQMSELLIYLCLVALQSQAL